MFYIDGYGLGMTKKWCYFPLVLHQTKLVGVLVLLMLFIGVACNSNESSKEQILSKCSILGDEAKQYGRANYLRLFHSINPKKFATTYQKIANFDNAQHRAMINTYVDAVKRLKTKNESAKRLIVATEKLSQFVQHFVDSDYPVAIKHRSAKNPQSDDFFMEINHIVKFDPAIKGFDTRKATFKGLLEKYNKALNNYANKTI